MVSSRRLKQRRPVFRLQLPQRVRICRTATAGIVPPGQSAANSGKYRPHKAVICARACALSGSGVRASRARRAAARAAAARTQSAREATKASTTAAGTRAGAEAATVPSARTRRLMLRTRRRASV